MLQRIVGSKENEICLQIGKKYRIHALFPTSFHDGSKYKDYTVEWSFSRNGVELIRTDSNNHEWSFSGALKMVNFGTWIISNVKHNYEIEEI